MCNVAFINVISKVIICKVFISIALVSGIVFIPRKTFQPGLMFARKAVTYPSEEPFKAPIFGRLLALPANIMLGCGMHATAKHPLLDPFKSNEEKSFIPLAPRCQCYKKCLSSSQTLKQENKLERLSTAKFWGNLISVRKATGIYKEWGITGL